MPDVFVARSLALSKWGAEVGVTKHLFKVGVTDGTAEAALKAMNEVGCAGEKDWKLVSKETVENADEIAILGRLAVRERLVDPNLYPRIKDERGVVKVKPANVENHLMVKKALLGEENIAIKVTPEVIGAYLIANGLR